MKIDNGVLLSVDALDLDSDGVLHIPNSVTKIEAGVGNKIPGLKKIYFPDSLELLNESFCNNQSLCEVYFGNGINRFSNGAFRGCKNVNTVQLPSAWLRFDKTSILFDSNIKKIIHNEITYDLEIVNGIYFHKEKVYKRFNVEIKSGQRPRFNENGICGKYITVLKHMGKEYISHDNDVKILLRSARANKYRVHFYDALKPFAIFQTHSPSTNPINILQSAADFTFGDTKNLDRNKIIENSKRYEPLIIDFIEKINNFFGKYNYNEMVYDIYETDLEKLYKTVFQLNRDNSNLSSPTKYLKRKPIDDDGIYNLLKSKKDMAGCFPFSFLENTEKSKRSELTEHLHYLFKCTSIDLYNEHNTFKSNKDVLKELSKDISKLINKKTKITYVSDGNFKKVFEISLSGNKYVWCIYHSDRSNRYLKEWKHDVEIQNSFLVSGKKYNGNVKFINIYAAGISNQRGERYLLYPFKKGQKKPIGNNPYNNLKRFQIIDFERENSDDHEKYNRIDDTIIDIGGIKINQEYYDYKFMTKIVNTILYREWDNMVFILNNYKPAEINTAIKFINSNIYDYAPKKETILAKTQFLKNKIQHKLKYNNSR